jgi:hypothetical protein
MDNEPKTIVTIKELRAMIARLPDSAVISVFAHEGLRGGRIGGLVYHAEITEDGHLYLMADGFG